MRRVAMDRECRRRRWRRGNACEVIDVGAGDAHAYRVAGPDPIGDRIEIERDLGDFAGA